MMDCFTTKRLVNLISPGRLSYKVKYGVIITCNHQISIRLPRSVGWVVCSEVAWAGPPGRLPVAQNS